MRSFLALSLLLLFTAHASAEIVVPAKSALGEPIIASTEFEAKAYQWESATAKIIPAADGKSVFIWSREGKHSLRLTAVTADFKIHTFKADFTVDESAPTPEPTPVSLRSLVDDKTAAILADYFTGISRQVATIKDDADFWRRFDATFPVKGNAKLDVAIRARLTEDLKTKQGFSGKLLAIAEEFKTAEPVSPHIPPVEVPNEPIRVTYVFEKSDSAIPSAVGGALNQLNRDGIKATLYEQPEPGIAVPSQYQLALEAARNAGLPALIVTSGNRVLAIRKDPKTVEEILEAVR